MLSPRISGVVRRALPAIFRWWDQPSDRERQLQLLGRPVRPHGKLKRLGTSYGGWIVPVDALDSKSIVYSVGAGEDLSFDCELATRYHCSVHVFDPTPRALAHWNQLRQAVEAGNRMAINNDPATAYAIAPADLRLIEFHPEGIWKETTRLKFFAPSNPAWVSHSIKNLYQQQDHFEADCISVSDAMDGLGHTRLDLLKMDVEGAEMDVLTSMLESGRPLPRVLCVELDEASRAPSAVYMESLHRVVRLLGDQGLEPTDLDNWNVTFLHQSLFQ